MQLNQQKLQAEVNRLTIENAKLQKKYSKSKSRKKSQSKKIENGQKLENESLFCSKSIKINND